jgi:hypothetical protein
VRIGESGGRRIIHSFYLYGQSRTFQRRSALYSGAQFTHFIILYYSVTCMATLQIVWRKRSGKHTSNCLLQTGRDQRTGKIFPLANTRTDAIVVLSSPRIPLRLTPARHCTRQASHRDNDARTPCPAKVPETTDPGKLVCRRLEAVSAGEEDNQSHQPHCSALSS